MTAAELIAELQTVDPALRVIAAVGEERVMVERVQSGAMPLAVGKDNRPITGIKAVVLMGSRIDFGKESRIFGHLTR